jgi:hypothetical protein
MAAGDHRIDGPWLRSAWHRMMRTWTDDCSRNSCARAGNCCTPATWACPRVLGAARPDCVEKSSRSWLRCPPTTTHASSSSAPPRPSTQIAASLARALRLSIDERDHLFLLIGHNAPARTDLPEHVSPALRKVLDTLESIPGLVQDDLLQTLAMNPLAIVLFGDETRWTGLARSAVHRWFTLPEERRVYPPEVHEAHGRFLVARLRMATTSGNDPARAKAIAADLSGHSDEFLRMWSLHHVAQSYEECTTLLHPEVGPVEVDAQLLFTENRSQTLVLLTPGAGPENRGKLDLLRVIGHQRIGRTI